jgi:hypothetical protein
MTEQTRRVAGLLAVMVMGLFLWWQWRPADPALVTASEAALEAWAEFASTGDLSAVEGHFDPAGPQYRQLEAEASGPTWARGRYRFRLSDPVVIGPGRVAATVTVEGPGNAIESYRWEIELRGGAVGWQIWSVRTEGK